MGKNAGLVAGVGLGPFRENVAPAAIGALDFAHFRLHLEIDARVTKRAASAIAGDVKRVGLDGFKRLSHGVCPRIFIALYAARGAGFQGRLPRVLAGYRQGR